MTLKELKIEHRALMRELKVLEDKVARSTARDRQTMIDFIGLPKRRRGQNAWLRLQNWWLKTRIDDLTDRWERLLNSGYYATDTPDRKDELNTTET